MRAASINYFLALALLATSPAAAQDPPAEAPETAPSPESTLETTPEPLPEPDHSAEPFQWESVAGAYMDPTSIFALHGYVNGVYASASPDWTRPDPTRPGPPGQLLVPNTDVASFQFDAGIVLSSQISPRTAILVELHAVTDPSGTGAAGPGGLTLAMTEATASWQMAKDLLRVSGGLYWAPFGTVNKDWMSAQNMFSLMPRASSAFPIHWNERGVRVDGALSFARGAGLNYVVSYGNGLEVPDITGQIGYNRNDSMAFVGRVGLFPGLGDKLDVGYSFARTELRPPGEPDFERPPIDPRRYDALIRAQGLDATFRTANATLRSYLIWSSEDLSPATPEDPNPQDPRRLGFLVEGTYLFKLPKPVLSVGALAPKVRFDGAEIDYLRDEGRQRRARQGLHRLLRAQHLPVERDRGEQHLPVPELLREPRVPPPPRADRTGVGQRPLRGEDHRPVLTRAGGAAGSPPRASGSTSEPTPRTEGLSPLESSRLA